VRPAVLFAPGLRAISTDILHFSARVLAVCRRGLFLAVSATGYGFWPCALGPFCNSGASAAATWSSFLASTSNWRLQTIIRLRLAHEGKFLWAFDGFHREIDVKVRPVQMMRTRMLDVRDLSDRRVTKPGKFLEWHKQLAVVYEEPKAVWRNVGDFSRGSVAPKRCGFHRDAPQ